MQEISECSTAVAGSDAALPERRTPGRRAIRRWATAARLTLIGAVAAVLLTGLAGPASAHDVLISSDPSDGSTLSKAPSQVSFTFDQPVQNFQPVISVTGPDGKQYQTGAVTVNGNVVSSAVALGPGGGYTAAYRVVSADGHPVTGEVRFSLPDAAVTGTPVASGSAVVVPPSSGQSAAGAVGSGSSGGSSAWIWIGLVVAVILVAAAAVVLLRKPSRDRRPTGSGVAPSGESGGLIDSGGSDFGGFGSGDSSSDAGGSGGSAGPGDSGSSGSSTTSG